MGGFPQGGLGTTNRWILRSVEGGVEPRRDRGVLIVASAGNQQADLQHPIIDSISPDWPPDTAETRFVKNNCRVAPGELAGVLTVSATGPIGYPEYDLWIASYSSVGTSRVEVAAPGGDYFSATGTVQDAVLGAVPTNSAIWQGFDPLNAVFPGLTAIDQGAGYVFLNGTSMSAPSGWSIKGFSSNQRSRAAAQSRCTSRTAAPIWASL